MNSIQLYCLSICPGHLELVIIWYCKLSTLLWLSFNLSQGTVSIGMIILFVQYKTGNWSQCWKPSASEVLDVISFYKVLCSTTHSSFPWRPLWRLKVPTKVSFFMWTAALGCLLTMDNLQKSEVVVLDLCCMCKKDGESIDHLFLHCHVAWELWNMVFSLFGVHWVMPCHVVDLLASWSYKCSRRKSLVIWSMIPHCIMWGVWRERNARTFEGCEIQLKI